MSNMYSLLNYIAATSKDIHDSSSAYAHAQGPLAYGRGLPHSLESGLHGLSEDEKRLVGISTISAVTRLALEFKMEEVCIINIASAGIKLMFNRLRDLRFLCSCNDFPRPNRLWKLL